MQLLDHLFDFFTRRARLAPPRRLLVAFSGGPDSTALAWGLLRLADRLALDVRAAHLDHALDDGSAARARRAAEVATALGLPLTVARRDVGARRRAGESPEAAARRERYDFLLESARREGAGAIATAHHRDDQSDTVMLRLLQGSGVAGLAAIREIRRGEIDVVRPLLALPRTALRAGTEGLAPVMDPTNDDLSVPRNRVRRLLKPWVERRHPGLTERLPTIATAAAGACDRIHARLGPLLAPRARAGGVEVERARLTSLPEPLRPFALALLHRRAGAGYPPPARAARELFRQLGRGDAVGCDCGDGWRWRSRRRWLRLERAAPPVETRPFAHRLPLPGEIELPEIGGRFRIARSPARDWMFAGVPRRAGLALPPDAGALEVRSRRPGDRIRPLGCAYDRRLKQVLIDRRVPRGRRDRLPLLCTGERVLWIPGVTVDESCRIDRNRPIWAAELERDEGD